MHWHTYSKEWVLGAGALLICILAQTDHKDVTSALAVFGLMVRPNSQISKAPVPFLDAIHTREPFVHLSCSPLLHPEFRQAHGRAQFPGFRFLLLRDLNGAFEIRFDARRCGLTP